MLRNYLTVAVRHLLRHKGYSLINIAGLAIGMACCILILLFVQDELSYDRYHANADRIYRLVEEDHIGGKVINLAVTPPAVAPTLLTDYPEVVNAVRFLRLPGIKKIMATGEKQFYEEHLAYADPTVFDDFTFPLLKGDPKTALNDLYSIVITEEMARKYFGHDDPMGKILKFDNRIDFRITGILQHIPHNSHFTFDFLVPLALLETERRGGGGVTSWTDHSYHTYLLLPKDYPPVELEKKLPDFMRRYAGEQLKSLGMDSVIPHLQPLTSIHLHSHLLGDLEPGGDIRSIAMLSVIALFVLLIACMNFVNLTTARSATRAKEVGMRKVVGAHRWQLIQQFLRESVLLSCLALLLAVALVELVLPTFNAFSGKELVITYGKNWLLVLGFVGIALFVGGVSGSLPAVLLSAFHPVDVFKGTLKAGMTRTRLRKVLVVAQFVISISLIIAAGVVFNQLEYMLNKELGFNKEHVVVLHMEGREERRQYESLKSGFLKNPGIVGVTASSSVPGAENTQQVVRPAEAQEDEQGLTPLLFVDHDFIKTLGIELATGRDFSEHIATDATEAFILNETAARKFGWESPDKAIGRPLEWVAMRKGSVIGVVKDFHFASMHQRIEPLVFLLWQDWDLISVRIRPEDISGTLVFLKKTWQEFLPNHPFEYFFLDENFDKLHKTDVKLGKVFASFSLLAIVIACLGLFGLASFTAEQRTKEVGIRKVLGASVTSIVLLLSKEFAKLVLVANTIAWPIAYYVMNRWLQDFAYRIEIGWGTFILGGTLALGIALVTVSVQAIKAALANPVDALRYE